MRSGASFAEALLTVPRAPHSVSEPGCSAPQDPVSEVCAIRGCELLDREAVHSGALAQQLTPVNPRQEFLHVDEARPHLAQRCDHSRLEYGSNLAVVVVHLAFGNRYEFGVEFCFCRFLIGYRLRASLLPSVAARMPSAFRPTESTNPSTPLGGVVK